jgi:hypothetical protein
LTTSTTSNNATQSLLPLVNVIVGPGGFASSTPALDAQQRTQVAFGNFMDVAVSGSSSVAASLGPVQATASGQVQASSAVDVRAVVITQAGVWSDSPTVRVAAQVHDAVFNTRAAAAVVTINVTPASFSASAASGSCNTGGSISGHCVAAVSIPSTWFTVSTHDETLNVTYRLGSSGAWLDAGQIALHAKLVAPSNTVGVTLSLPTYPLHVGEQFTVNVQAFAGTYAINTFRMIFETASGQLQISSVTWNTGVWAASVLSATNYQSVITASPANPASRPVTASAPETLCQVTFTVLSTVTLDAAASINCTVVDLFDNQGLSAYAVTPASATFWDRDSVSSSPGHVYVENTDVVGLLPYTSQSAEFVNMAVLTGQTIQQALVVLGVRRGGAVSTLSSGLSCVSSDSASLQVQSGCSNMYVNGSETSGSARVDVTVTYGSLTSTVWARVWHPDQPLAWQAADTTLNAVSGWLDAGNACRQRYQSTKLRVFATFRCSSSLAFVGDVTSRVAGKLASSDPTTAAFAPGTSMLTGLAAGTVNISLSVPQSQQLGYQTVVVSDVAVHAVSLAVTPVESIVLSGVPSSITAGSAQTATAAIQQTLTREFQSAYVYVEAAMEDGSSAVLTVADGLNLTSGNTSVLQIAGQTVVAVGSGTGYIVNAAWLSGSCSNITLATGVGSANSTLPTPTGVEISVSATKLTAVGDAAALVGVATQASITVRLVYADGTKKDMTNDTRTVFDDTSLDSSDVVKVTRGSNNMPLIAASGPAGSGSVLVKFTHVTVSGSQALLVVLGQSASLGASPYPSFTGSDAVNDVVLNLIAETGVYQQVYLRLTLMLTDSSSSRVDASSSTSYQTRAVGSSTPVARVVTLGSGSSKNVVSKNSTDVDGAVDIVGVFAGTIVSNALTVSVSSSKVIVQSIDSISFPATLTGTAGTTAQAKFGVTFNDSSKWTSSALFSGNNLVLNNLVSFATSNAEIGRAHV